MNMSCLTSGLGEDSPDISRHGKDDEARPRPFA